jgi:signal transduction histidine kinase
MHTDRRQKSTPLITADWRTWTPLAALILALIALVLLPVWRSRQMAPVHDDLRAEIQPARTLVTRIHLALAMEGMLAREFLEHRDSLQIEGYRQSVEDEREAYDALRPHMDRLGPAVRTEFNSFGRIRDTWHKAIEQSFAAASATPARATPSNARNAVDPFHPAEYERLLVGAARLDEALSNAAERRWVEADATNRAQRWMVAVVGLIAFAAAMIVAWLGRGLRIYALTAERDRANLEQAIEARARLVRGITHDLKNPLNAIVGYTDLLTGGVKGPLKPDQLHSVERIRKSAHALLALIDDILDVARAERRQLSIVSNATRVESIIAEAVEDHEANAAASGLRLDVQLRGDLPAIATDATRVRQILGNLLSNAIKYTPPGGRISVRASVKTREETNGERWVAIDVTDTGTGIPADKSVLIFEEFTRLDEHRDKPGAGLGLAIALRIARLLGGDLTVESNDGSGAVFTLWLPIDGGKLQPADNYARTAVDRRADSRSQAVFRG